MSIALQVARLLRDVELRFLEDKDAAESTVDCVGCHAPCCRAAHLSAVPLSLEEAQRLPHVFGGCQLEGGAVVENVALLPRHPITKECAFVTESGKCSIWEVRPKACRAYSCLTDAKMADFVRARFGGVA